MIKIIKEVTKKDLENWIYTINESDKNLYIEANNPDKIGIFQINGSTAERLCDEVKPENFNELIAINAMARPGPMETCAPFYVERKESGESPYPKIVEEILNDSHYTFLYQEQIMKTFHEIAGFTLEEADVVRGLMKKLGKADKKEEDLKQWDKILKKFIKGAIKLGIEEEKAIEISKDLQAFSGYSFCKAHATSYAYIALITLYLSFYFREYFYSSVLQYEVDRDKYLLDRINSVRRQGIELLPPDINKSKITFIPEERNKIRYGLNDIKFVSENAASIIIENAPYTSFFDCYMRTKGRAMTSKVLESLVSVGAFDSLNPERKKLLHTLALFWERKKSNKVEEKLKAIYDECEKVTNAIPAMDTKSEDLIKYELQFYGFKIFSSLFTKERLEMVNKLDKMKLIYMDLDKVGNVSKKIPITINGIRSFVDKNGNEMAFLEVEDINSKTTSVPVFASYWRVIKEDIIKNKLYLINVYMGRNGPVFGQSVWTEDEAKIKRMIKVIGT